MTETFKSLALNQFEAALRVLFECVERCPPTLWNAPSYDGPYCQAAFHAVFYADVYLGSEALDLRAQEFHRANAASFRDYEELEDRAPVLLYEKAFIKAYIAHCLGKARATISAETESTLAGPSGFARRKFTRAELYIYNTRHIQHHGAQLALRLQAEGLPPAAWVGSGWGKEGFQESALPFRPH